MDRDGGTVMMGWLVLILLLLVTCVAVAVGAKTKPEPEPKVLLRYDVNQDGCVTGVDADLVYSVWLDGKLATPSMVERCDVNQDGFVDELDVVKVMDYLKEVTK